MVEGLHARVQGVGVAAAAVPSAAVAWPVHEAGLDRGDGLLGRACTLAGTTVARVAGIS